MNISDTKWDTVPKPLLYGQRQAKQDDETFDCAVRTMLVGVGEDPTREGLLKTPERVRRMYTELFAGYDQDPTEVLNTTFDDDQHQELVIVRDIPFYSFCEHHMVPFYGSATMAYIPNGKLIGLSKFARLLECFSKRLQIQERLTSQLADTIEEVLSPRGVAIIIHAEHMCMSMRGVKKPGTSTVTSAMRGAFLENDNNARLELLQLMSIK